MVAIRLEFIFLTMTRHTVISPRTIFTSLIIKRIAL